MTKEQRLDQHVIEIKRGEVERSDRNVKALLEQYQVNQWKDVVFYGGLCGYEYHLPTTNESNYP